MRIGLFGTVMHDEIYALDGTCFESFGGILYNLVALSAAAGPEHQLVPFGRLSPEHLAHLRRTILADLPNVDLSHLYPQEAGTDSNILRYVTPTSRREHMKVVSPPLAPEEIAGAAECDAAVVNFISGHELDLHTFRRLGRLVRGPVYLDVHNLGRKRENGVPVKGHRFHGWPEWFRSVDMVQGNEWEAERFFGFHPEEEEDFRAAAALLLSHPGPRIATLTLGGQGAALAWREADGAGLRYARVPALPGLEIVDTTGCGDSFSAGFLMEYLRTGSELRSALFAATLSGLKCQCRGLEGMLELENPRPVMHEAYAGWLAEIERGWRGDPLPEPTLVPEP